MKVNFASEQELTDEVCRQKTGRAISDWFQFLDDNDGLKAGRRNCAQLVYEPMGREVWWSATIAVEYERHHNQLKKDGLLEGYGICSTKTVNAPVSQVYDLFATPQGLSQWFGDAVEGGSSEGEEFGNADGRGKWLRLRPGKDVRFLWRPSGAESDWLIDAMLADKGGKTAITLNSTRIQNRAEADGCRAAWADALNRLKTLAE